MRGAIYQCSEHFNFFPVFCWDLSGLQATSSGEDCAYQKALSRELFICDYVFIMLHVILSLIKLEEFYQDAVYIFCCLEFCLRRNNTLLREVNWARCIVIRFLIEFGFVCGILQQSSGVHLQCFCKRLQDVWFCSVEIRRVSDLDFHWWWMLERYDSFLTHEKYMP